VRIELIPVKDFFGDGGEDMPICLHFLLLDIVVVFVVSLVFVVEIETGEVLTKAFVTTCALVVLAVRVLEVDAATGNHSDFV